MVAFSIMGPSQFVQFKRLKDLGLAWGSDKLSFVGQLPFFGAVLVKQLGIRTIAYLAVLPVVFSLPTACPCPSNKVHPVFMPLSVLSALLRVPHGSPPNLRPSFSIMTSFLEPSQPVTHNVLGPISLNSDEWLVLLLAVNTLSDGIGWHPFPWKQVIHTLRVCAVAW